MRPRRPIAIGAAGRGSSRSLRDLRYGARTLFKSPGFALAGIVILGLGIGVNSAIFTVVNAVVLRPLPFTQADRIVRLWHTPPQSTFPGMRVFALSPANFLDWEAQSSSFEAMAIYRGGRPTLTGQGEPTAVQSLRASASFLPIFGLQPIVGRGFTPADDRAGAAPTVLLSEGFWRSRFGADPAILGQPILLNLTPYTVVGVVPAPSFLEDVQVWTPLLWGPDDIAERANHNYRAVARLKPGVPLATAQADLDTISARLEQQYPAENKEWGALVVPLHEDLVGDARLALLVLLGAVALVLLIACANLANLMLVRTHGRAKEIALRGALGASRLRVVQQLLAEGVILGIGGGLAGFAAAIYGVDALVRIFGPAAAARAGSRRRRPRARLHRRHLPDHRAARRVLPGLAAERPRRQRGAQAGRRAAAARRRPMAGVRQLLVVSEVALALMLLIGAGLLMRSLTSLRAVDPGFDARNVLTASIGVPMAKYDTEARRNQFFDRVRQDVQRAARRGVGGVDRQPADAGRLDAVRRRGRSAAGAGLRAADRGGAAPFAGLLRDGAHSDPGWPRLHRGGRLRPARCDHPQRAHRAALLAGAEPARQARHAEDDVARAAPGRGHRRRESRSGRSTPEPRTRRRRSMRRPRSSPSTAPR